MPQLSESTVTETSPAEREDARLMEERMKTSEPLDLDELEQLRAAANREVDSGSLSRVNWLAWVDAAVYSAPRLIAIAKELVQKDAEIAKLKRLVKGGNEIVRLLLETGTSHKFWEAVEAYPYLEAAIAKESAQKDAKITELRHQYALLADNCDKQDKDIERLKAIAKAAQLQHEALALLRSVEAGCRENVRGMKEKP